MLHLEDCDPALRELHGYWQAQRGDRAMPTRGDIDPAAIPRLLPKIMLIGVEPGPRFRYRLMGSELIERFGRNATGLYVDEVLAGAHREFMLALYADVCDLGQPVGALSRYVDASGVEFRCSRLVLPLSCNGIDAAQLLSVHTFEYESAWGAAAHPPKIAFADPDICDIRLPVA
jgi:hypothetical protein